MFREKRPRLLTTVGCQASNEDEAIHGGKPTPPTTDMKIAARELMRRAYGEAKSRKTVLCPCSKPMKAAGIEPASEVADST